MRIKPTFIAVLFFLATAFSAIPATAEPLPRHSWQIGPEAYYHIYKEESVGVELKGMMVGGATSYTFHGDNRLMFRAEGRAAWGDVDYVSGTTGSSDNESNSSYEGRLLLGYDFKVEEYNWYTFYSGFGYHRLENDGGGVVTTTGHLGYDRISNYYYLPLGLEGGVVYESGWKITASLEADLLLSGKQESLLSTTGLPVTDFSNDQNKGWGFRGAIKFEKETANLHYSIEPFFRGWAIEESEVATAYTSSGAFYDNFIEPDNKTYEFGANASLLF